MSIRRGPEGVILLEGACPVEEAETLLALLLSAPGAIVDWSACTKLHTAVFQVLVALRPRLRGDCQDPFVRTWLAPRQTAGDGMRR